MAKLLWWPCWNQMVCICRRTSDFSISIQLLKNWNEVAENGNLLAHWTKLRVYEHSKVSVRIKCPITNRKEWWWEIVMSAWEGIVSSWSPWLAIKPGSIELLERVEGSEPHLLEEPSLCILALLKMIRNKGLEKNPVSRYQGRSGNCTWLWIRGDLF